MREEPVVIASGALKLEGLLARTAGPARAAVMCHPHPLYGGTMNNNVVEAALEAFWKLGFATLRFNFRGVGASEGEHSGGVGESDDAKAAMKFLFAQPEVMAERAVIAGYSFGAGVVVRAGADIDEVDTICAVALPVAVVDFSKALGGSKRIVLVAGDRDAYCPVGTISDLAEGTGDRGMLKIIPGADHFFGGDEAALSAALVALLGGQ